MTRRELAYRMYCAFHGIPVGVMLEVIESGNYTLDINWLYAADAARACFDADTARAAPVPATGETSDE